MNYAILFLNIIGTFLVSIEAIKLDNIKKISSLLRNSNYFLNPKIEWTEDDSRKGKSKKKGITIPFFLLIIILFSPLSFLVTYHLLSKFNLIFIILIGIVGSFVMWTLLILLIESIIKLLEYVVVKTMSGIIGILGFLILTISFWLQFTQSSVT